MKVIGNIIQKYKNMSITSKATIWFLTCTLIQKGLSFITTPIFTRLLTTEQFGTYSVYCYLMQILIICTTLRLDYAVFNKGMSKYPKDRDGYASSMLGFSMIITTAMLVVYLVFQNQINSITELGTVLMLAMFAELYVQAAVSFWALRERYEFHYKAVVFYTLFTAVSSSVFGIVAVSVFEDGGSARILSNALIHVLAGSVIVVLLFRRGRKFIDWSYIKFALLFNVPLMLHYFSTYLIEQSDRIMIQKLDSLSAAALYSVAYTVGGLVNIVTGAISNTLIPSLYRWLERKDFRVMNRNILTLMLGVTALVILVALAGPEVVLLLGGEEYLPAVYVIPPVAASAFFSFLYTIVANIEFYYEKNKFAMKISVACAVVNVVLNYLLIPIYGYVAAAYTTLFSYMVFAVGHIIYVNRLLKRNEQYEGMNAKMLGVMGAGATVCCIATSFLYYSLLLRCVLAIVVVGLIIWKGNVLLQILKKRK